MTVHAAFSTREEESPWRMNSSALYRLLECLDILRDATGNSELQMQAMLVFIFVAQRHPNAVPSKELEDRLTLAQTTVSRNLQYLGNGQRDAKGNVVLGGYQLVETAEDPYYRKRKLTKLTKQGEEVAGMLSATVLGIRP